MKEQEIDFVLENERLENGNLYFTAKSLTKDFTCEDGLNRLSKNSPGKPFIWRHEHPADMRYAKNHIYGEVLNSEVKEGHILSDYVVYGHTPEHKKLQDIIRKRKELGDPLCVSMRFRTYFNENGEAIHYDVIEHSGTPTPACKECKIIDILNEGVNMNEEELKKQIEQMEKELTLKDKKLEDLQLEVEKLKKTVEVAKSEITTKDSALEEKETEKEKLTKQLTSFEEKLNEQNSQIEKMKQEAKLEKIMPLIEYVLEEDGNEMKDMYVNLAKSKIIDGKDKEAVEFFEKRLERFEARPHAVTESLEKSASKAGGSKTITLEKEKELAKVAFRNNPELYKKLYGDK